MISRHPSRQRLQRWLDTGAIHRSTRRTERHVDDCQDCQSTLEELTELDEGLVADLQMATAPPADLTTRINEGVDDRLRNAAAIGAFLDLFTIGWDVTRTILDPTNEVAREPATEGDITHDTPGSADESDGGTR